VPAGVDETRLGLHRASSAVTFTITSVATATVR
jgi:hypothetical protein